MKRIAFALACLLSLGAASAQDASGDWFWGKPIASIQWEGIQHVDKKELESTVRPYVGKAFTEETWSSLQAQVYALDWFDSIEPTAVPQDDTKTKVVIKFQVKEKPSIASIKVSGNSGLRSTEILDVVTEKMGDIYSAAKAKADETAIKDLYLTKGYPDTEVSSSVTSADGQVSLAFLVVEGTQVSLKEIGFSGNESFAAKTLKAQLDLKESGFLQAGTYQESKLETDKQKILEYYRTRGYIDVAVQDVVKTISKDPKTGKSLLSLTFVLAEGKKWTYGGVSFEGNQVFTTEKLTSYFTLKPGAVLNLPRVLTDKSSMADLYYENGYIFNQIAMTESRDTTALSVSYKVKIVERDRAHIESLSFKGNEKTKEYVLTREIPLEVGDIFSKAKILEGLRNLYNLQYFSSIDPQMLPGTDENLMNLVIAVEEQSTASMQFGVTLSGLGSTTKTSFPLSLVIKWNEKNLLGNGQTVGVELSLSPTDQEVTLSYLDSYLFGKGIPGGLNLSFIHKDMATYQDLLGPTFEDGVPDPYTSVDEYDNSSTTYSSYYKMYYDYWAVSAGLSSGYSTHTALGDFGVTIAPTSTLSYAGYDETMFRPASKDIREVANQWLWTNKIPLKLYLNNLNLTYNPTSGFYASEKLTWAGLVESLEAQKYIRTDTKLEAYLSLFKIPVGESWNFQWVLAGHSAFSAILPQPGNSKAKVLPTDDLTVDGTFVGRGWVSLDTIDDGRYLWDNWLEVRMPIMANYFWLDGFIDADILGTESGFVSVNGTRAGVDSTKTDFSNLGWDNLILSTGLGIRFTISQFPFRFYVAKRFCIDDSGINWTPAGESAVKFVISISTTLN